MIIYKITNKINNKCCVGATKHTVESRFFEHMRNETALGLDIIEFGRENFELEELELLDDNCSDKEVRDKENYYIDKYHSIKNGYNNIRSQYATQKHKSRDERKEVLEKYRNVLLSLIFTHDSIDEIASQYDLTRGKVLEINRGAVITSNRVKFPIRRANASKRLSNQRALELINDLKEGKLTLKQLASKYNISCVSVDNVNQGLVHYTQEQKYPLNPNLIKRIVYRCKRLKDITQTDIDIIVECLKKSVVYDALEKELCIDRHLISIIDKGKYKGKLVVKADKFPIRPYTSKKRNMADSSVIIKNIIKNYKV